MPIRRVLCYLWALPNTLLGLPLVALAVLSGGTMRRVQGVLEAHGPALAWLLRHAVPLRGGAAAMTIGHVVIGRDAVALARCRTHELVHVRQYERWGPLFLPAYVAGSLLALLQGRDPYHDNPFEREAFDIAGG